MKKITGFPLVALLVAWSLIFSLVGWPLLNREVKAQSLQASTQNRKFSTQRAQQSARRLTALSRYAIDLTALAHQGRLEPIVGYNAELGRVAQILNGGTKKNPLLVVESSVGGQILAEGLAHKMAAGEVTEKLRHKRLFNLNLNALLAGIKGSDELESRLKDVLAEVESAKGEIILFVDGIDELVGAKATQELFVSTLLSGSVQCIGAIGPEAFQQNIENDEMSGSLFQAVWLSDAQGNSLEPGQRVADTDKHGAGRGLKMSADLRELAQNGEAGSKRVDIILQADDLKSSRLRSLLQRSGARIKGRFHQFGTMAVSVPARAVEELAASRATSYLSLDREVSNLGHVESTTGADAMREQSGNDGLEGDNIGIAVIDSGLFRDHDLMDKIVHEKDFTGEGKTFDKYGHGTHVTGLIADKDAMDGRYIGIAPKAEIINLRVLNSQGVGSVSNLIKALNWILEPVDPKNPSGEKNHQK